MAEQELFYPMAPTPTSRRCRGATYKGERLVMPHWAETAAGGDSRVWNGNRCPSCSGAVTKAMYAADPERSRQRSLDEYYRHRDAYLVRQREYWAQNRERFLPMLRQWRIDNPERAHMLQVARRVREGAALCEHGPLCFAEAKAVMPQACAYCGATDNIQADHWMPLALGGQDCRFNLQPLCRYHNAAKHDTHPLEYEARIGFVRTQCLGSV